MNNDLNRAEVIKEALALRYKVKTNELENERLKLKLEIKENLQILEDYKNGTLKDPSVKIDPARVLNNITCNYRALAENNEEKKAFESAWQDMVKFGFINP